VKNALISNQHVPEFYVSSAAIESTVEIEETFEPEDSSPSECRFRKLVLEAVDEAFVLLGDAAKQAVYWHLEGILGIDRRDIPYEAERFTEALEKILGPGAKLLEIHMMKLLCKRVGKGFRHYPKHGDLTFKAYVAEVHTFLEAMGKIRKLA
jgi:hypothetical protein